MVVAGGGLAAVATLGTGVAHAANTFTVTNLNDSGSGSLRAAVAAVNADTGDSAPGDSIVFASNLSGTLALSSADTAADSLNLSRPVQIQGPGADRLTIRSDPGHRIFYFDQSSKLSGLKLTGGSAPTNAGGAIFAYRPLELDSVVVEGNSAKYAGGVFDNQNLTVNDSTVSGNAASAGGGGIFCVGIATTPGLPWLTLNDSTVSGNSATGYGGGVVAIAGSIVENSTITGNSSKVGAGMMDSYGPHRLTGDTIAGNTVTSGGIGQVVLLNTLGSLTIQDSIVSGPNSGADIAVHLGSTASASFSLIRDASTPVGDEPVLTDATDITGQDPQLAPLAANGGPTATMMPLPSSPALDHGKSFGLGADERGLLRPFGLPLIGSIPAGGDRSDIGAVEAETPRVSSLSPGSGKGGTQVGIAGHGFTGATEVLFGSTRASFSVQNDGAITAVAPRSDATQDVRVITPLGESPVVSADKFKFPQPTVKKHTHPKLRGKTVNTGIQVICPAGGTYCQTTIKATAFLSHRRKTLAKRRLGVSAGHSNTITFKLSKAARKQLARSGRLRITIQIVVAGRTFNRAITVKR